MLAWDQDWSCCICWSFHNSSGYPPNVETLEQLFSLELLCWTIFLQLLARLFRPLHSMHLVELRLGILRWLDDSRIYLVDCLGCIIHRTHCLCCSVQKEEEIARAGGRKAGGEPTWRVQKVSKNRQGGESPNDRYAKMNLLISRIH